MQKIVVAGRRLFMKYPTLEYLEKRASEIGAEVVAVREGDDGVFDLAARDAAAVVVIARKVSSSLIGRMSGCRLIQTLSVGYDCVDVSAATARRIPVSNTPVYCTDEVANHAITLLFSVARKIPGIIEKTRAGEWDYNFARPVENFAGRSLGIVGLGKIGRRLVPKARAFGLRILAYDPYVSDDIFELLQVERRYDLQDLLPDVDYLSVHAPLNGETYHLIDGAALAAMKEGAVLVNTARGGLLDEEAVVAALDGGRLAGVGIDVLETEPPSPDNRLLAHPLALVTPHIAWYSEESLRKGLVDGAEELVRVLQGKRPRYVVNPEVFFAGP